jgi:hypothetical protein
MIDDHKKVFKETHFSNNLSFIDCHLIRIIFHDFKLENILMSEND